VPPYPRASVNLRQLLQSDTVEFRPFFQTLDPAEVVTAVEWCRDYLLAAMDGYAARALYYGDYAQRRFPPRPTFHYWMERRWAATAHKGHSRAQIKEATRRIWRGEFDDISNEPFEHLRPEWL